MKRRVLLCAFLLHVLSYLDKGNIANANGTMVGACFVPDRVARRIDRVCRRAIWGCARSSLASRLAASLSATSGLHRLLCFRCFSRGLALCSCQMPANYLMKRLPTNVFFMSITVAWGLTSSLFCLVTGLPGLIVLRILLGAAEAGSFSGTMVMLSLLFRPEEMASLLAITTYACRLLSLVVVLCFMLCSAYPMLILVVCVLCSVFLWPDLGPRLPTSSARWLLTGCSTWTGLAACMAGNGVFVFVCLRVSFCVVCSLYAVFCSVLCCVFLTNT